jgi:hypothetical protein
MTITRKDLEPLKELHSKGTEFFNLLFDYMRELEGAELYNSMDTFLAKVDDIVYDLQKAQDEHDDENQEPQRYHSNNPFFEVT